MQERNNFEEWYGDRFGEFDSQPPADVWDGINHELDNSTGNAGFFKWTLPLLFAISIVGVSAVLVIPYSNKAKKVADNNVMASHDPADVIAQNTAQASKLNQQVVAASRSTALTELDAANSITTTHIAVPAIHKRLIRLTGTRISANQNSTDELGYSGDDSRKSLSLIPAIAPHLVYDASSKNPMKNDQDDYRKPKLRSGYIGVSFGLKNTWMWNRDTYNGLKSSYSNETNMDFGKDLGLVAGYNVSDNIALQAGVILIAEQGQKYKEYEGGKLYEKDIDLKYSIITTALKVRKQHIHKHNPVSSSFNLSVGPYIGFLRTATAYINYQKTNARRNYTDLDYGVNAGLEYEVTVNNKMSFSSGLILNTGFKNIFRGSNEVPGDFNVTRNTSLGVNFGVNYLINCGKKQHKR